MNISFNDRDYGKLSNIYDGYLFFPILLLISTIFNTPLLRRKTYSAFLWFTPVILIYLLGLMIFF